MHQIQCVQMWLLLQAVVADLAVSPSCHLLVVPAGISGTFAHEMELCFCLLDGDVVPGWILCLFGVTGTAAVLERCLRFAIMIFGLQEV